MGVLAAAKEWGCPPWEIAGGHKLTWYIRWQEYRKQIAEKVKVANG